MKKYRIRGIFCLLLALLTLLHGCAQTPPLEQLHGIWTFTHPSATDLPAPATFNIDIQKMILAATNDPSLSGEVPFTVLSQSDNEAVLQLDLLIPMQFSFTLINEHTVRFRDQSGLTDDPAPAPLTLRRVQ